MRGNRFNRLLEKGHEEWQVENRTKKDEDNRANANHVAEDGGYDTCNRCALQAYGVATLMGGQGRGRLHNMPPPSIPIRARNGRGSRMVTLSIAPSIWQTSRIDAKEETASSS